MTADKRLLVQNVLLLGERTGWILIDGERIVQMGEGEASPNESAHTIDGQGMTALPGFIDMHVHGSAGRDTMDATPEAIADMARFFAAHGVTGFLATTVTAPGLETKRALENAAACTGRIPGGATVLGAHLEGPYINLNAKGAQDGRYVRRADPGEYRAWLEIGVIRQVTTAPEFADNREFIRECAARGVVVSIGHTQATYEEMLAAVELGARQATHTFNAMTPLHHRKPGAAGAALTVDKIACEVIADTIHVHPAILNLIVRAKGTDGVIVVTDAVRGAGMPDGLYHLGELEVNVSNSAGMVTLRDGTLAGSILTMDRGLRNMLAATGLPLSQIWPMTSANAARQLGIADRKGALRVGYDADLVLLDNNCMVQLTIAQGEVVFNAQTQWA